MPLPMQTKRKESPEREEIKRRKQKKKKPNKYN